MVVHLIDGTYELFRHFYALPSARDADGREVAAVRGVVGSVLGLFNRGATHVGVATDHVIESFRNELWPGYKTGAGIDPAAARRSSRCSKRRWPRSASWCGRWSSSRPTMRWRRRRRSRRADPAVERVLICTPDKDLAQCVRGTRVVPVDRRTTTIVDEAGVVAKFGVPPASIPDYLALVGDSADGYPGPAGWGAKSAAAVLARFGHLEAIPDDPARVARQRRELRPAGETLVGERERALLFRDPRDAAHRPAACSIRWTSCNGEGRRQSSPRSESASTRRWSPPSRARGDRE